MEPLFLNGNIIYTGNTFSGIYGLFCNKTNKWYVGESKDVLNRINAYSRNINGIKKQILVKNALKKYGIENFNCYKLEECSFDILREREAYWGNKLNSIAPNGYNLKIGGGKKVFVSDITRKKLSKANSGKIRTEEMKKNISIGTKKGMTQEVCAKIAEKAKNRGPRSEEIKEKISISMLGKNKRPRSEEIKEKIRIANIGKKQSKETIQKKYVSMKVGKIIKWLEEEAPWFLETSTK